MEHWLSMIEAQGIRPSDETRRRILANDIRALQACVARDRTDASSVLASLKAPLLAVAGTQDPIFAAVRALAEKGGGSFIAVDGRNHVTTFLASERIAPAIETFLATAAVAARGTSAAAE